MKVYILFIVHSFDIWSRPYIYSVYKTKEAAEEKGKYLINNYDYSDYIVETWKVEE